MEAIFPITALQKNQSEVREQAAQGIVRVTENGNAAYIFCTESVFEQRIQQEREDAAYEARLLEAVSRGLADIENERFYTSIDRAFDRLNELRAQRA